ncbi:helix-turn-helix domain-containing protein [Methylobacterium radiotolerans]|uniref:helix-turn-helix domain-containing protein n=1 Tax=Methylobacterium radiotolerans TaxID=31998 RepID=UPI000975F09F|nr:XRE family transcriptional regulator [Methylobacterium radiotolerans]ONF49424.1 XRE family transcriptional regulator [Methylobacterium radiotolerans]
MSGETFSSVWDALCDTPEEAANMKARSALLSGIIGRVKEWDLPQGQAAERVGLTRPRLNDLLKGKIDKFSLDALVNIASAAGLAVRVELAEAA